MTAYSRSILASLLITPVYLKPIDTIADMLESPSELRVPAKTALVYLLKIDPRPDMQELYARLNPVVYAKWTGEHPQWFRDRFDKSF